MSRTADSKQTTPAVGAEANSCLGGGQHRKWYWMRKSAVAKTTPLTDRARRRRKLRIARALVEGGLLGEVAKQEGLSVERVRQILHEVCSKAYKLRPHRIGPEHDMFSIDAVRKHRQFWLARIGILGNWWHLSEES
jgi:DNA-directed RNA polymerase sigma subunit (sigma70/sigma32)